jgi:signal transduction histidine kinase
MVEEVLERNLTALAPEAERARVEVIRRFPPKPSPALGDPDLLYRAFLNVFNNALQAMQEQGGGNIIVSTSRVQQGGQAWVAVTVEDTGPGFDRQMSGRLFDPFFTTKEQGTGLGLSIVRSIIDSHQGKVELGAGDGGGAKVEIRLRAA